MPNNKRIRANPFCNRIRMFTWSERPKNQVLTVEAWANLHLRNEIRPEEIRNKTECILCKNRLHQLQALRGVVFKIQKYRKVSTINKDTYFL